MAAIAKRTKRYPSDLTDEEWSQIKPLLPMAAKRVLRASIASERDGAIIFEDWPSAP